GLVDVVVTTAGGTSANTAADDYTFVAAPSITSLAPTAGPAAGANSVVISGANFTNATAVKFGATNATGFTVDNDGQITATAPAHAAGTVDVSVTTAGGTSANTAADDYTFVAAPSIARKSPAAGPTAGANAGVNSGAAFTNASAVKFGATNATGFTVGNDGQITATAPAHAAGTVDVSVTTAGGTSANTAADDYTFVAAPSISSLSPTAGPSAGGNSVTISGSHFTGATSVTFGAAAALFTV